MQFDVKVFLKYLVFVLLLVIFLVWRNSLLEEVSLTFDFSSVYYFEFLMFVTIGVMFALLSIDVHQKKHFGFQVKLALIPFLLLFGFVSTLYLTQTDWQFKVLRLIDVSIGMQLMFAQIMLGFVLMQFFTKDA